MADFGKRVSLSIPKYGDLISNMYISISGPPIDEKRTYFKRLLMDNEFVIKLKKISNIYVERNILLYIKERFNMELINKKIIEYCQSQNERDINNVINEQMKNKWENYAVENITNEYLWG